MNDLATVLRGYAEQTAELQGTSLDEAREFLARRQSLESPDEYDKGATAATASYVKRLEHEALIDSRRKVKAS
jgi:hypothetical protein